MGDARLMAVPVNLTEANLFVKNFHRHNTPTQGGLFAIGASIGDGLIGVAIVGRVTGREVGDHRRNRIVDINIFNCL